MKKHNLKKAKKTRAKKAKAFLKLEERIIRMVRSGSANPNSQAMKNMCRAANEKLNEYQKADRIARLEELAANKR